MRFSDESAGVSRHAAINTSVQVIRVIAVAESDGRAYPAPAVPLASEFPVELGVIEVGKRPADTCRPDLRALS
jgi:hypothetical protein